MGILSSRVSTARSVSRKEYKMRKEQLYLIAITLAMLTGLLFAAPVSAQDLIIADAPSMQHPAWYSFTVGKVEDASDTKVTISSRDCSTRFQVFTPDKVDFWARPEEDDWFGEASYHGSDDDDGERARGVVWSGNLVPGAYYVRCSGGDTPPGISGEAVSRLQPINRGSAANTIVMRESPNNAIADEVAEQTILTAQDNPGPCTCGAWIENVDNDVKLLKFQVGRLEDETPRVTITMHTQPFNGTGEFQVFTAGNAPCAWGCPEEGDWIGRSNDTAKDDEYYVNNNKWSGELVPGGYVVRVEPHGAEQFMIGVAGKAVTY